MPSFVLLNQNTTLKFNSLSNALGFKALNLLLRGLEPKMDPGGP